VSGTTVYYNSEVSGSFNVTVSTSAPAGISNVTFPSLVTLIGSGADSTSPYRSNDTSAYTWDDASTYNSMANATCYTNTGASNYTNYTITRDVTSPSGGVLGYADGHYLSANVTLTFADGTDAGSGVNAATTQLLRQSATLSGDSCGAYGAWGQVGGNNPTSPYDDTSVSTGNCYQYRYQVYDNVLNGLNYTNTSVAKIDTGAPSCSVSGISESSAYAYSSSTTVYYNSEGSGSFSVEVSASDAASGIENVTFETLSTLGGSGADDSSPYQSSDVSAYTFSGSSTYSNLANVTCYDTTGQSTDATYNITRDVTDPAGGYIVYADSNISITSFTVNLFAGNDTQAGLSASQVQRRSTNMTGTECDGTYGPWSNVGSQDLGDTQYIDTVSGGMCYQYQYEVLDRVSNEVNYSSVNRVAVNTIPQVRTFNVTPSAVLTTFDIDCRATIWDGESATMTVEWYWYNGSDQIYGGNSSGVSNNTENIISSLGCGNTSVGETWNCTIRAYDGMHWTGYNSSTVTITGEDGLCQADISNKVSGANITERLGIGKYTETGSGTDEANSSAVSMLNLSADASTIKWQGFIGEVEAAVMLGSQEDILYSFGNMPNGQVESVYATTDTSFNFAELRAASGYDVDTVYGWNTSDVDSASSVYEDVSSAISGVVVWTANLTSYEPIDSKCNESVSTERYYHAGVFTDDGSIEQNNFEALAYGVTVTPDKCSYNKDIQVDYELIVPVNNTGVEGTQTYYIYMDIR